MWPRKEKVLSCDDCGLCCQGKGISIVLDSAEEAFLRSSGTALERDELVEAFYVEPESGCKAFEFKSPCGFWKRNQDGKSSCTVYGHPCRPEACDSYERGGEDCLKLRAAHGLGKRSKRGA
jgi:Fe-S-cluster containining protein